MVEAHTVSVFRIHDLLVKLVHLILHTTIHHHVSTQQHLDHHHIKMPKDYRTFLRHKLFFYDVLEHDKHQQESIRTNYSTQCIHYPAVKSEKIIIPVFSRTFEDLNDFHGS